jgi:hypothetical protein
MNNQNILAIRKSIVLKLVEEIIYARPNYQEIKKEREQYVQYRVKKMLDKKKSGQKVGFQATRKLNSASTITKTNSNTIRPQISKQKEISISPKSQDQNKRFNEMFIQRKSNVSVSPITRPNSNLILQNTSRKEVSQNQSNIPRPNIQQLNVSNSNATQSTTKFQQKRTSPISSSNQIQNRTPNPQDLPATIRDLRPMPTFTQLDLGKLNPVLKDPTLSVIICEGAGKNIIVKRAGEGNRPTPITLNEQEIQEVVQRFSQETKIPFSEGAFRTIVGSNLITANISPDNKVQNFIITKIAPGR